VTYCLTRSRSGRSGTWGLVLPTDTARRTSLADGSTAEWWRHRPRQQQQQHQHPCTQSYYTMSPETRRADFNPLTLICATWVQLQHSVNLILSTLLLVHLIVRISPHHSHHLRFHHLSLPRHFTPDLKNSSLSQILSSVVTFIPFRLPSRILTCTELKGHWLCLF